MKIIVDTREQKPFAFVGCKYYADIETELGTLSCGDYSLAGFEDRVAVERKELGDLINCLGFDRRRFEKELARSRELDAFCVVVEASYEDIAKGNYRSRFDQHAIFQSLAAFTMRYNCAFWLAGSHAGAEYMTYSFLRQYAIGAKFKNTTELEKAC